MLPDMKDRIVLIFCSKPAISKLQRNTWKYAGEIWACTKEHCNAKCIV